MTNITRFKPQKRICLTHSEESYFLAVDEFQNIFVEEYYDGTYIAQYIISSEGEILKSIDENYGKVLMTQLEIPENAILPDNPREHPLNYHGMRFRGMREAEKVMEWVQSIPMMEKMPLLQALKLTISPMMIFGIAESHVLSETVYSDTETLICRRIRLLQALPEIHIDDDGLPYDYDTITFHVIQIYDTQSETATPLHEALLHFSEIRRPMDCIYSEGRLYVTNSGENENLAEIHIFQFQENEP